MRAFVGALALWSLVVLGALIFEPGYQPHMLGCMKLVGRSAACEAQQHAVHDAWWWLHTLPLLTSIAAGYVAIVSWRIRAIRRRRTDSTSGTPA